MSLSKLNEDSSFSRWQIAAVVGGVIFVTAGAYYFIYRGNIKETNKSTTEQDVLTESSKKQEADVTTKEKEPIKQAADFKAEGNKLYKSGKYEEAIQYYSTAIDMCPEDNKSELSTYYQNRAAAYEQMKEWENVLKDCTSALSLNERYLKALTRRAKACEILNDLEQALEDLTAACIIESFNNQATMMNIDRVLKNIGKQHAKEAMQKKEPLKPSRKIVEAYFDSFCEDPIISNIENGYHNENHKDENDQETKNLYEQAKMDLMEGKYDDVLKCCNTELSNPLSEHRTDFLLLRATLYILYGVCNPAMQDLDEVISNENCPNKVKVNALIKRATLHVTNDGSEIALEDLNKAISLNPKCSDIYHHRGQVHLLLGKVDEAVNDFDMAVKYNSDFPIAVVQRCYTIYRDAVQNENNHKITESKKDFEEAIKKFPRCIESYILYAQVLTEANDFDRANEMYLQALTVEPDNANILVHQAMLLLQWKGDLKKAIDMIKDAIKLDEANQLAYENLATIHVQMGNLKEGVEVFDKAILYARTEMEMAHLFALRDAAVAQLKIVDRMGIVIPSMGL